MTHDVLLPIRQLGKGRVERRVVEQWVIAEAARPLGPIENDALGLALCRRLAAAGLDQRDHAAKARGASERGDAVESFEELGAALRVVEPLAPIASGDHAGGAAEGVHLEAG